MRLPTSLAVRIGTVAAAAAIAVTGATTVASAAVVPAAVPAHAHRIPTRLAIGNSKPVARAHQTTAVLSGHLTAGRYDLRHLRVWLQRLGPKGKWDAVQTELSRPFGHVFFRIHVGKKPATFRLVFRGTRNFAPAVSHIDTISPAKAS
jgi:hypothetical protein